ncbi:histone deacetylase, putative, partial [Eimeria tenella]
GSAAAAAAAVNGNAAAAAAKEPAQEAPGGPPGGPQGGPQGGGPAGAPAFVDQISRFNIGEDCPVFEGLWEYCKTYSGGSIEGARRVVRGEFQCAINWAGGLHHGKKHEASGFCYVNDCVLAALEFLRFKHRVLYVDVDIHHGDGVEEAFYTSPRVLCCSFHKYGHFFPGTGALEDIGLEEGLGYSVNVPLHEGIDDQMYSSLFQRVRTAAAAAAAAAETAAAAAAAETAAAADTAAGAAAETTAGAAAETAAGAALAVATVAAGAAAETVAAAAAAVVRCAQVMDQIMEVYRPEAVVFQCGADSVAGDRLGCFNLSLEGHSEAVRYFCRREVPAIFLGGGGYTLGNVPRCWAKETACILGLQLSPKIPESCVYRGYYGPNYELKIRTTNMENRNDEKYIDSIVQKISTTLRQHVYPIGGQISANFTDEERPTGVVLESSLENEDKHGDKEVNTEHFCKVANPGCA